VNLGGNNFNGSRKDSKGSVQSFPFVVAESWAPNPMFPNFGDSVITGQNMSQLF